ncbi:RNA polymerase sigma factor (sigma-70 family) [Actinomadura pelletieri DSM 43383]|uniref:RNA polymerase sigma factor (Sigma-70 family) n=1 Tax=Actinomadura pelletieri DSM 43383 TaxID=1120940 RepID=A0A495QAK9_9ACTN|nr:sigma-70 family RNA polymerase sigma factor [Actinomadura pelletieri]RKS68712.1 RNA polymerase sigma factor (sigma-70 family) [Actinomadura pelletieri DSM 43383]
MAHKDDGTGELVVRARDGDGAAWARLVERYSGLLWSIARSHGLNDADSGDVVQTTWLRLVERIGGLRDPSATGCWLATTARRESLRLVRLRGRDLPVVPAPRAPEASPERVVIGRDRVGRVGAALGALPRRCRTLLRLFAAVSSQAELAAALGIPVGSVGPTRARCLDALRRLVQ